MSPSPFSAGNSGSSRGGIIDLPTPKRAANIYVGKRATVPSSVDLAALEMTSDSELPALLGDLELGEALDPALLALESAGARSSPAALGLDLSDLPAPVGPLPRSPLSTRVVSSPGSVSRPLLPANARASNSKPGAPSEPEPLPEPPTRGPLLLLGETLPPVTAPLAEGKKASRPDYLPVRAPLDAVPPPAERITVPSAPLAPATRETQPMTRRASPSGSLSVAKPVHTMFDSSEPAPPPEAPHATAATPPLLPLPALPSDESGGRGPAATSAANSANGALSEASGHSFPSGGPGTSSTATTEPRPLRLGYLICALAVLALLLAVMIARIAGIWNKQSAPVTAPGTALPSDEPGRRPTP